MANYVVTTRGKDGSLVERAYTANDRADLFKKLTADGVNAVRVREGTLGKKPRKSAASGAPSKGRGLIAAAIVILGVGAAVWFLMPSGEKPARVKKVEKKVEKPVQTRPESSRPRKKTPEAAPPKPEKRPPQRVGELRDGYRLLPSGRLHRVLGIVTSGVSRVTLADKTFDRQTDRMIAHLLTAEFGGTMIGDSESIFKGFNKAFKESLKEDIVIKSDDTDEVKELKQAVLDARNEILAQMKEGKDAESVMIETRNQLLELTLYREDLEKQVLRLTEDGMSQEDYDELIAAANIMLKERGSKAIQMPSLVADAIEMRFRHEEARRKEIESKQKNKAAEE